MSPPAHRPRSPAPSSIATATAGSDSKRSSAASMPSDISYVIALISFGRFSRTIPAPPPPAPAPPVFLLPPLRGGGGGGSGTRRRGGPGVILELCGQGCKNTL